MLSISKSSMGFERLQRSNSSFTVKEALHIPSGHRTQVTGLHNRFIRFLIKASTFFIAIFHVLSFKKAWRMHKEVLKIRENIWAGDMKKLYKIQGRYFFNQYASAWPSRQYNRFIKQEIDRRINHKYDQSPSFIFLGVTSKCPLRCEHCLEGENLNKPETFSLQELDEIITYFKSKGVLQMHLSGGETMLRAKDLVVLLQKHALAIDFWILTSGFNCIEANMKALKRAGLKGVVVSIDHYIAELHDGFRRKQGSFQMAVKAVKLAQEAGLATAISVCVTKAFLDGGHLQQYAEFAAGLEPEFVQILEPKDVGNYKGQDVLLEPKHIDLLEDFFKKVNHSKEYSNYPSFNYHGYHQRRLGCYAGSRSMYIDTAGNVHACPFCHTASYNIKTYLAANQLSNVPAKANECPRYNKVI